MDELKDALRSAVKAVDDLSVAAAHDRPTDRKLAGTLLRLRRLAKLAGVEVTDAELHEWLGFNYTPPAEPDPAKPLKGARIVGDHLYRHPFHSEGVLAIRHRAGGYEVVSGRERWGVSSRSGFSGYDWSEVLHLQTTPDLDAAVAALTARFAGHTLRKTRRLGA